jgi:hypothetical protein
MRGVVLSVHARCDYFKQENNTVEIEALNTWKKQVDRSITAYRVNKGIAYSKINPSTGSSVFQKLELFDPVTIRSFDKDHLPAP